MKKAIVLLMAVVTTVVFIACSEKEKPEDNTYEMLFEIVLGDQEIAFTPSTMSQLMLEPYGVLSSVMKNWNLSGEELYDLLFAIFSDPENNGVRKLSKIASDLIAEKSGIGSIPFIIFTVKPIKGPGEGIFQIHMSRQVGKIYISYETLEDIDNKTMKSIYYYIDDAAFVEELLQKYYDGRILDDF